MRKLVGLSLFFVAAIALATPAQAHECNRDIHIHTGLGVAICRDI